MARGLNGRDDKAANACSATTMAERSGRGYNIQPMHFTGVMPVASCLPPSVRKARLSLRRALWCVRERVAVDPEK